MEGEIFILIILIVILSILMTILLTKFIKMQSKKGQGLEAVIIGAFFTFIIMYVIAFLYKIII